MQPVQNRNLNSNRYRPQAPNNPRLNPYRQRVAVVRYQTPPVARNYAPRSVPPLKKTAVQKINKVDKNSPQYLKSLTHFFL